MRILGVDLGHHSVKAIELESSFGRVEIKDYFECVITPQKNAAQCLAQIIASLSKQPEKIISLLSSEKATFRNLTLPTRDAKVIRQTLLFELEDDLPFELDQCQADSVILSQSHRASLVHVAATLKETLRQLLEEYKNNWFDPDYITTDTWALRTLFTRMLPRSKQTEVFLFLQIGKKTTLLYSQLHAQPILSRSFNFGGDDLTDAISEKYEISFDEAEKIKIENAFVVASSKKGELTGEQLAFSEVLESALYPLITEIKHTLLSIRNQTEKRTQEILISGGTSLLPGIKLYIEEETRVKTRALSAMGATSPEGMTFSQASEAIYALPLAAALTQISQEKSKCIQLRKGEFAKDKKASALQLKNFKKPLLYASCVLITLIFSLFTESLIYQNKIVEADKELERAIKSFFPDATKSQIRSHLSNPSKLRTAAQKELDQMHLVNRLYQPHPKSPIAFLKDISAKISKDTIVDLISFEAGSSTEQPYKGDASQSVEMSFLVNNPQVAEKLGEQLKRSVNALSRTEMKEAKSLSGDAPSWRVHYTGKPKDQVYDGK